MTRDKPGFDVILMNPPWERIKLQEKEWFAARSPDIASATNAAARKRMITALQAEDQALWQAFQEDMRGAESESHFIRNSGKYPLCGRGDVNTYAVFTELVRQVLSPVGRVGVFVPTGIATDDTTKFYFQDVMGISALASLYDFENRRKLFPAVDSRMKFSLLTLRGADAETVKPAEFVFFALDVDDLREEDRRFTLTAAEIGLLNPNTRTCPIFRSKRDAELTKAIYRRVPVLVKEGQPQEDSWQLTIRRIFDMNNQDVLGLCHTESEANSSECAVPMYESKLMHQYDHRWARYTGPKVVAIEPSTKYGNDTVLPSRYFLDKQSVASAIRKFSPRDWFIGWRDITNTTNERTVISCVLPVVGTDFTLRIGFLGSDNWRYGFGFVCSLNTFVFDYCARQMTLGTHLSDYIVKQLPVIPVEHYRSSCTWFSDLSLGEFVLPRVLELTYTAWDLQPFAHDCGYDGPPFRWDEDRRFLLRCELDAAYFHLYGIERDDVDYIMETFPIVKRKDIARHGEYRTKRVILEMYDDMAAAMQGGAPYVTRLDPPPADARVAHDL